MINIEIEQDTEKKLKYLLSFHTDKNIIFRKFINYQLHELQTENKNLLIDINEFEKKYKQKSENFYQQFTGGKTGDSQDVLIWAGLYEVLTENKEQIALLK